MRYVLAFVLTSFIASTAFAGDCITICKPAGPTKINDDCTVVCR